VLVDTMVERSRMLAALIERITHPVQALSALTA